MRKELKSTLVTISGNKFYLPDGIMHCIVLWLIMRKAIPPNRNPLLNEIFLNCTEDQRVIGNPPCPVLWKAASNGGLGWFPISLCYRELIGSISRPAFTPFGHQFPKIKKSNLFTKPLSLLSNNTVIQKTMIPEANSERIIISFHFIKGVHQIWCILNPLSPRYLLYTRENDNNYGWPLNLLAINHSTSGICSYGSQHLCFSTHS